MWMEEIDFLFGRVSPPNTKNYTTNNNKRWREVGEEEAVSLAYLFFFRWGRGSEIIFQYKLTIMRRLREREKREKEREKMTMEGFPCRKGGGTS